MAITRERKEELVALYGDMLQHTTGFVVTEYRGLTVKRVDDLRAKLRDVNGVYAVTKNTLFKIALQQAEWPIPEAMLAGPVATAFADGNFPGVAKVMLDFQKDNPDLVAIKGAVMGGLILSPKEVQTISELPSLDELRAQLAGLMVQPATGLVSVLNAATSDLVNVLHAYVQKHEDGSEAA